jgi:hypothetical protein
MSETIYLGKYQTRFICHVDYTILASSLSNIPRTIGSISRAILASSIAYTRKNLRTCQQDVFATGL